MFNCSLWFLSSPDYCECISSKPTIFLPLPCFTCLSLSIQGINTVKEVFFLPQNVLPTCQSGFLFLFLCWSFYQLTDSYCPLSESSLHPSCLTDACYIYQLVERLKIYFWYSTNFTFFSFSSSFSSPSLVFPPLRCCCRASLQPT